MGFVVLDAEPGLAVMSGSAAARTGRIQAHDKPGQRCCRPTISWSAEVRPRSLLSTPKGTKSQNQESANLQYLGVRRKLGSESVKTQFSKIYFSQTHFYRSHKLVRPISSYLCLSNTANLVLIKCLISLIVIMLCWPPQVDFLACRKPSRVLFLLF
jgi:hypothetical protein